MGKAKATLRDAAAVNTTRKELAERLRLTGLPVETGSGGLTKFNRTKQGYSKAHFVDAACVGQSGASVFLSDKHTPLLITATGHGSRQMCRTDKYGFPNRHKLRQRSFLGFTTGDIVQASVPGGKYKGTHYGRIAIRFRPSFRLGAIDVHPKYLTRLHRADGYDYRATATPAQEDAIPPHA